MLELFDHLVGEREQLVGHVESERPRSPEVAFLLAQQFAPGRRCRPPLGTTLPGSNHTSTANTSAGVFI